MTGVLRKEMVSPLILSILYCSVAQLSSGFVIQNNQIWGSTTTAKISNSNPFVRTATRIADEVKIENPVNKVLETLEKRLNEGSLSGAETSEFFMASDLILENLKKLRNDEQPQHSVEQPQHSVEQPQHSVEQLQYTKEQLQIAVGKLDADAVSTMLNAGLALDEKTNDAAFWTIVNAIDRAEARNLPLSGDVTRMLHHVFDADMDHLLQREKVTTNITCMQPDDTDEEMASRKMNYVFDDADHKNLPLMEGRKCEGGSCCDKCSRNIFPTFALDNESSLRIFPDMASLTFNNLEKVPASTIIQFVRLIERVRRTIAHEYGLPLSTILPLQAYSRKYVAGTTQQGGGGGEGDFVILHTDESTHDGYHYSCVLYLSTQGEDFEGGDFIFNDPSKSSGETIKNEECEDDELDDDFLEALRNGEILDRPLFDDGPVLNVDENDNEEENHNALEDEMRRSGREFTSFHPKRGSGVIFSSGWENMHEVEKITSGTRYAVPCFFTTCPVPEAAYDQMKVGKPQTDEDIADDWIALLLAHRKEEPMDSVGRVKELLMKWHYMCTPLSEH
eukprot:CAMPEP_0194346322 /NCGR_PEP_ID=MMETSP0171-20130528/105359_1 /TAXON_ID=218684 /ORGANISM="Corethron pennatum, Strain L29A3" /LENGTH=561 /DNA_ID=CAMNT_0039113429 /DNA_START=198 /DNA_END=1883 /DNA_ORIENTATION=+